MKYGITGKLCILQPNIAVGNIIRELKIYRFMIFKCRKSKKKNSFRLKPKEGPANYYIRKIPNNSDYLLGVHRIILIVTFFLSIRLVFTSTRMLL